MIVFSDLELQVLSDFEKEHLKCYKKTKGVTSFTIKQSYGSGIGVNTYITCDCCGEMKDVTDYGVW